MVRFWFVFRTFYYGISAEPFEVAFVRTMYTVDESAGPVLVCVNLTRPEIDILDETVNVFVIDFLTSMYIPVSDVPFASESTSTYKRQFYKHYNFLPQPLIFLTFSVGIQWQRNLTFNSRLLPSI